MIRIAIILSLIISTANAQDAEILEPKLSNLSWISGTWTGQAFGGTVEEIWSDPNGDSMMGSFRLIKDGKVVFYELEIIRELDNALILQLKHFNNDLSGWETKDETVDFPLIKITENKAFFEGLTFEKISDNRMNIYVDLENNGQVETLKIEYSKSNR